MAKKSSIKVTTTGGVSTVIGTADILKVLTEGTGSRIWFSNNGAQRRFYDVIETPGDISSAAGTLIQVTDDSSSTAYYISADRVNQTTSSSDVNDQTLSVIQTQAAVAQVDTVTLTGTSGTADVTINSNPYTATFNTDLTTTADDFVTSHAATILSTEDIVVTAALGVLTFTANIKGNAHTISTANTAGDLDGVDANVTPNAEQQNTWTPANVEIGDVFYATAAGETVSFTATAATVANVTAGLKGVMDAAVGGWATYLNGNTATDNTTDVTTAGIEAVVSASVGNTSSFIFYENEGAINEKLVVSENIDEINTAIGAL